MSHGPPQGRRKTPKPRGPMGAMMKGDKASDFKGTMKKLIKYLGRYRMVILIAILIASASTAASIFGPKILG
ncbi:MAG: ABC transporter ATP-binding protein, partial [Candidatus Heimdallarchaeota archaeon]|nr:ABC transporter ATP-binding protein [Candidatus Heimdallarchaeota archaeon]